MRVLQLELARATFDSDAAKYLVYYDGPANEENVCGQGGGAPNAGAAYAIVYLAACPRIPSANVAAHELLHALGAMPAGGPLHPCPDSPGHPCDSSSDILYPFASSGPLADLLLDAGRDDYYGFVGGWFDVQDSAWLRKLDAQVPLSVTVAGAGSVSSLQPGPACATTCSVEWDAGSFVQLEAEPAAGQRLLRWSGACTGSGACSLRLTAPAQVMAVFGPAAFRLAVSVRGKGLVRSTPIGMACRVRCSRPFTSFQPVRLRAVPARGWRLARWTGGCTGRRPTCTVRMRAAATVQAVFVRA
jgi:hypothetical protein